MTAKVRGFRGATTVGEDTPAEIKGATQALVSTILERNGLVRDDIVSIIFTTTPDITSAFPATAARELGLDDVPLLGAQEVGVPGALERCIRVLVHAYSERERSVIRHVYLAGAEVLRTDLVD